MKGISATGNFVVTFTGREDELEEVTTSDQLQRLVRESSFLTLKGVVRLLRQRHYFYAYLHFTTPRWLRPVCHKVKCRVV